MADFETLMKDQKVLHTFISNFIDNTKKCKATKAFTSNDYASRSRLLDTYWSSFYSNDLVLQRENDSLKGRSYFKEDISLKTCNAYLDATAWLQDQQQALSPRAEDSPGNQSISAVGATSLALEKLKLPKFDGEQRHWESFKERFTALVLSEQSIPSIVKFHHLLSCLEGEAASKLSGIQMTADNFITAWDTLCRRYDDRLLRLSTQLQKLANLPAADKETPTHINLLLNSTNESINVLNSLQRPVDKWDDILIFFIESKLASCTRIDWARELEQNASQQDHFPTYQQFRTFLENRVRTLDRADFNRRSPSPVSNAKTHATSSSKTEKQPASHRPHPLRSPGSSIHVATKASSRLSAVCTYCKGEHSIYHCSRFASASLKERQVHVQKARLCCNCLSPRHLLASCPSQGRCFECGAAHHTKLHEPASASPTPASPSSSAVVATVAVDRTHHTTASLSAAQPSRGISSRGNVLLSTACVVIQASGGHAITARALLDSGAEESFLSEHIVQALGLRKQPAHVVVSGVGETSTVIARHRVDATLKSTKRPEFSLPFTALVLSKLTTVIPRITATRQDWPHLSDLPLADPHFGSPGRIDCILNSAAFAAVLLNGVKKGPPTTPTAFNTVFGWVLFGQSMASPDNVPATSLHHVKVDEDLSQALQRFWEIEESPEAPRYTPLEQECHDHFKSTHTRNSEGRFIVRLPFSATPKFHDSMSIAASCLSRLERRFSKDTALSASYHNFMTEYEDLGHMHLVPKEQEDSKDVYYLPHHPVFKKGSSKLRVVFNASQRDHNGSSLNDYLLVGPKLQEDVLLLMVRWAFHRFVFSCDVVKMFRQFLMHPDDTKWQRILWRTDRNAPVSHYDLSTVTYGTSCAPFLANACMLQLAADEQQRFPKGAEILAKNRYADDCFAGGDTLEETLLIRNDLIAVLATAGMSVDKWTANHFDLVRDLPSNPSIDGDRHLNLDESVSTLGIRWRPIEDTFWFKVSAPTSLARHTKRTILSEVAKLFDPIGWLSPVIIRAKILLQVLWLQGVDWDAPLPPVVEAEWIQFRSQLAQLEDIQIPRWFRTTSHTRWQLHGFCDASERAYAAAVYIVATTDLETRSTLVTAKSKVAPIKVVSLPRLELCGAVLLVRILKYLVSSLDSQPTHIHCWTDSRIVLAWLRSHPCKWKSYIANRTSEILTDLPQAHWRHVRSSENLADLSTRGLTPQQLSSQGLWWTGPCWLRQPESSWPQSDSEQTTNLESKQSSTSRIFIAQTTPDLSDWLKRHSSIDRIIRILAYIHRWRSNATLPEPLRRKQWLSAAELAKGRSSLLRLTQRDVFHEEIRQIHRCGEISKTGPLRRLLPFLDSDGLLRVGGRLQNSSLSNYERHPIILPNKNHITTLIIRQAHHVTLHGGSSLVQGWLSRRYWIIGGRNLIRQVVRRCITCTRFNAITQEQLMGSLPAVRTRPARPFSQVGVDYAGPFYIRTSGGRGQKSFKGYVAVFVCLVVKAVHLELVSDYTSQAFLAAFKRFVARRGLPATVYSDNGTTFQGADAELRRLLSETAALGQEVAALISQEGVKWSFIPPRAPHFGGIWEANYYNLMETSKLAKVNLQLKPVTIFAPLNSAFQKFKTTGTEETEAMVLYHITSVPKTIAQLGSSYTSLNSEIAGNPPLWITHVNGKVQDELYVNNAMILVNQSNIQAASPYGNQVLHKIDEILIPTRSSASSYNAIYNPTAWEFLENYESLINQSPHRVRNFRQKVQKNNKQDVFNIEGGHTFFIPIDEGFANNRANLIDDKIIDGHVIPRHVLFTRPTRKDFPFETSASRDNIKVVVSFTQEQEGSAKTDYVKSHTLFGDGKHAPGVVLAEIVRPNIPVKNGVIHLIQKPLMVVDSNVKQLLEEKDGHILSRFMQVIKDQGPPGEEFLRTLERTRDVTLFAPSNNALEGDLTLNVIMSDKKKFMDILKMHLVVDDRLYVEKILKNSRTGVNQAPTSHRGKYLYFNVMASEHNRTLTVEGGGVNATVIQPDIAATNGIIHVIDRVLGVPYATVLEKIKMDPLLKTSYALGGLRHFNNQLNDTTKKFTYFIPSDKAWFGSNVASPLAVRKLFLAEYAEQATRTLERHLVISDEPYTMERIKQLTLETHTLGTFGQKHEIELPTKAGPLKLLVEERADNTFIIIWKGEQIPVLRANVECTNGIIHIIDVPFVKVGDLPVGGAATPPVGALLLLMLSALVPALTIVL